MSINILEIKARLLSAGLIVVKEQLLDICTKENLSLARLVKTDNLYAYPWIFIHLGELTRIRMIVKTHNAPFELSLSTSSYDRYDIIDTKSNIPIIDNVELEDVFYHCPNQLFYDLYEFCFMGCKFCPLSGEPRWTRDTIAKIMDGVESTDIHKLEGIGLTSGIPAHLSGDKVAMEMAKIVKLIREKIGFDIPIGVSPLQPTKKTLEHLKASGVNEVRINLEIYNPQLSHLLTPKKEIRDTLKSIQLAVEIFGKGKVSSNLIVGIGETDDDIVRGITALAELGAIATLYPYDPVPKWDKELSLITGGQVGRPSYQRLISLALEHKKILDDSNLLPISLMTMCPRCGASHLMPGTDL